MSTQSLCRCQRRRPRCVDVPVACQPDPAFRTMPASITESATPVSLRRLFASASFVGCGDVAVSDVSDDSRECRPGCLFAALPGHRTDGLDHLDEAIQRGATALLLSRP